MHIVAYDFIADTLLLTTIIIVNAYSNSISIVVHIIFGENGIVLVHCCI